MSGDQIGLHAQVRDRRMHDQVRQQHYDLGYPNVGAELRGIVPGHLGKRLKAVLPHHVVDLAHRAAAAGTSRTRSRSMPAYCDP